MSCLVPPVTAKKDHKGFPATCCPVGSWEPCSALSDLLAQIAMGLRSHLHFHPKGYVKVTQMRLSPLKNKQKTHSLTSPSLTFVIF